jgi:hypothetical protein
MTPSARLWKLQANWALQMVHLILGRTSQGSSSPPSGAYIRYRHISEIGGQSRTIPMAHVHGRKHKNSGDTYNVRTGDGVGKGIPAGHPTPLFQSRNTCSLCARFSGFMSTLRVRMVTNEESEKSANTMVLTRKTPIYRGLIWWRVWGSNPRPLECHSSALPTELTPLLFAFPVFQFLKPI